MSNLKKLAQDTAIYGISSIVGRFLNWCLVPLYSYVLVDSGEFGIVTNLYAWSALVIIILTYGMETGFFRFVSENPEDEARTGRVYSTTLTSLAFTSTIFAVLCVAFHHRIASAMGYESMPELVAMLGTAVALDAFTSIPFGYLRYKRKPLVFASLKMLNIIVNIACNLFFLIVCPRIAEIKPELIAWFYDPLYGVGYIFVSNLIASSVLTIALLPWVFRGHYTFDALLLRRMLGYSLPLLLLGVAGIMNQTIDKIIFPIVYPDKTEGLRQLGIYGACFKISMVMMMFTNAFRFAYEPFVFAKNGARDNKESYADAMKFYFITALLILLGMVFYIDVFQYILAEEYRVGLAIIPVVLVTYLVQGIVFNLSLWYKLVDKTYFGAVFSLIGFVITLVINVLLIPHISYWACAAASLVSYIVMMVLSYVLGQKYYPVNYPLRSMAIYAILAIALLFISWMLPFQELWIKLLVRTMLLAVFVVYLVRTDLPLSQIPIINKIIKKTKHKC